MEVDSLPSSAGISTSARRVSRPRSTKFNGTNSNASAPSLDEHSMNGKRKRGTADDGADSDSSLSSLGELSDAENVPELEPDVEAAPPTSRPGHASSSAGRKTTLKKPAAKRTKNSADTPSTARVTFAPGVLGVRRRAAKKRKPRESAIAGEGDENSLYSIVFAGDMTLEHICAEWIGRFRADEATEMAELFTFVLRASGCEFRVDTDIVQDPDHFAEKLTDIQDEYQSSNISDYPLARKASASFKQTLQDFFHTLIRSSAVDLLFDQLAFMDNLHGWVGTMTSAGNRPFRHTSTIISLAIISGLCEVGRDVSIRLAATSRQLHGERRKARPNTGRIQQFESKLADADAQIGTLKTMLLTWFDTVFVHRYRDIDPRIRVDCVQSLSGWITVYPDYFFDGKYLRYLGWVLSDTQPSTRLEVLKQLRVLFSDPEKIAGLNSFAERFRPRMVEMAVQDADAAVRSASIELLSTLRDAGLLEPNDIDAIGRLVFDSEARVRKAVVPFFAASVLEGYDAKVEELGGEDAMDEALDEAVRAFEVRSDNELEQPRADWLKLKCVADLLDAYDASEGPEPPSNAERAVGGFLLSAAPMESRFSVAARALCEHDGKLAKLLSWEGIAAYLLVDHSASAREDGVGADVGSAAHFQAACRLSDRQHMIMLEVLHASLRHSITEAADQVSHARNKSRLALEEVVQAQEETTKQLAHFLPRLLNKFGDQAGTASAVLKLEPALNLQIFQALRQESTVLAGLLDEINKQFMTHGTEAVLSDASRALLHAKSFDELDDITASRVQSLWDDTLQALHAIIRTRNDARTRGKMGVNALTSLSSTMLRLAKLSAIAESSDVLDASPPTIRTVSKGSQPSSEFSDSLSCIAFLLLRGIPERSSTLSAPLAAKEDAIAMDACRIISFYFLWQIKKVASILSGHAGSVKTVSAQTVDGLVTRRNECFEMMTKLLVGRRGADDVKCVCAGAIMEVATAFATLRRFAGQRKGGRSTGDGADAREDGLEDASAEGDWTRLVDDVSVIVQESAVKILGSLESALGSRLGKAVSRTDLEKEGDADVDADPVSDDEDEHEREPMSDDDDDDGTGSTRNVRGRAGGAPGGDAGSADETGPNAEAVKMQKTLLAEQRLCDFAAKLVLACEANVVDPQVKERLQWNKSKLGPNYREVVDFFDKLASSVRRKESAGAAGGGPSGRRKGSGNGAGTTTAPGSLSGNAAAGGAGVGDGAGRAYKKIKSKATITSDDEDELSELEDDPIEEEDEDREQDTDDGERMEDIEDSQERSSAHPDPMMIDFGMSAPTPGGGILDDESDLSSIGGD